MEIKFKKASKADLPGLIALCNECFEENTELKDALVIFDKYKEDKNQIYVVGKDGNKVVAGAKITIIQTMFAGMGNYAMLNHICVKEEYRRHNIATHMLDYISEICKKFNCREMTLWSKNFRVAAHACYKNYGFDVIDAKFFSYDLGKEKDKWKLTTFT